MHQLKTLVRRILLYFLADEEMYVKKSKIESLYEVKVYDDLTLFASKSEFNSDLSVIKEIYIKRRYSVCFPFNEIATIIDIGGHKGYFSIFAHRGCDKKSKIFCLEPIIENYAIAEKNFAFNACKNIQLFQLGIFETSQQGEIFFNDNQSSGHSLFNQKNRGEQTLKKREISLISLEDFFIKYDIKHCDFLKMDCEGAEYSALFNASNEIFDRIDTISMEFHDIDEKDYSGLKLAEFLNKRGYYIVKFDYDSTKLDRNYGELIVTKKFH